MRCYGQEAHKGFTNEYYERGSRDCRRRAAQLRTLGYGVGVSAAESVVVNGRLVKLSQLYINHPDQPTPALADEQSSI